MPLLFYGYSSSRERMLFAGNRRPIESSVFDSFKIDHLAPYRGEHALANLWWIRPRDHMALSWHDQLGKEVTVFIPGKLGHNQSLAIARDVFGEFMPPYTLFRINNEDEILLYD